MKVSKNKIFISVIVLVILVVAAGIGYWIFQKWEEEKPKYGDENNSYVNPELVLPNYIKSNKNIDFQTPLNPWMAEYSYENPERRSYFYPYRRYVRPYWSNYNPGRWVRHYGNYYYTW